MNVEKRNGVESVLPTVESVHLLRFVSAIQPFNRVLSFFYRWLYVMHLKVGTRGDVDIKIVDFGEFMRKEGIERCMLVRKSSKVILLTTEIFI